MGLDIGVRRLKIINDEEIYWRKANQIYNWFDKKFGRDEDGGLNNVVISKYEEDELKELLDICNKVIESLEGQRLVETVIDRGGGKDWQYTTMQYKDIKIAKDLLPTIDGFFFGPLEYGEYYLETTKATKKWLDEFFENGGLKENEVLEYWASW